MASSAGAGLGAGLGTLFQALGNQKLRSAQNDVLGQRIADQHLVSTSTARENNSKAGLNEDQLSALQGLGDVFAGLGYTPQQSSALGGLARANGGTNLQNAINAAMEAQIPVAGTPAVPQVGDVFQQALGRNTTKVSDGVAYNPVGDASQPVQTTPVGLGSILADKARAAAGYGQANAANAHARLFDTQTAAGGFNPHAGAATNVAAPPVANANLPTGDAYLQSLPADQSAQVKALAEGRMQFPSGYALKTPYWQQMLSSVAQYDPNFDAVNYNARYQTRRDFTSGKSAQQINALNTAIGHLNSLSDAADALNNSRFPGVNKVTNWLSTQSGDKRVNNFDTTRKAVVDELTRVWRGTGGSEKDIETWTQALNDAGSPDQLHGAIAQIGELMQSKINALAGTYAQGMGTTAQATQFITPKSAQVIDALERRAGITPPDVTTSAAGLGAPDAPTQSGASDATAPPTPTTQADFDALPSGALYIDPDDGKTYRKP